MLAGTITSFILLIGQSGVIGCVGPPAGVQAMGDSRLLAGAGTRALKLPSHWNQCANCRADILPATRAFQKQLFWLLILSMPTPLPYALSVVPPCAAVATVAVSSIVGGKRRRDNAAEFLYAAFCLVGVRPVSALFCRLRWAADFDRRAMVVGAAALGAATRLAALAISHRRLQSAPRVGIRPDASRSVGLHVARAIPCPPGIGRHLHGIGFRLSIQTIRLLMVNMTTILFPAFTKLNDQPQRQYDGFFKAQRILAMIGVSGCLLQAAVADPLLICVFRRSGIRRLS